MIHRYRIDNTPDMSGKLRGMIGSLKNGDWCKYEDVKKLEEEIVRLKQDIIDIERVLDKVGKK